MDSPALTPALPPIRWHAEALWESMAPLLPGFTVEVLPEVDSTNSELMRRARSGQTEPVLLVAERQSAGRGRLGRAWHSDAGGDVGAAGTASVGAGLPALTFSLGLPLPSDAPAGGWSALSLAVGLALVQSLHADLRLKWPNDVWLGERKLAGILMETTNVAALRYLVVGVGINIALPQAQDLRTPPAALRELLPLVDAPAALARVALPLVQAVQAFAEAGFAPLREAFHARDALYGRAVTCSDASANALQGEARGVDASGALLVHTLQGLQKISSADVSVRPSPSGPSLSPRL